MSKVSLNSLFQLPENTVCADCGKKDPRWASHNLGVFICIGCSGIHRSLGTHISKVKSIDLDKWTEDQLENMMNWGNARANKYWQAKLPADFQPPESGIESFIRAKYERKQYVLCPKIPDPATLDNVKDENRSQKEKTKKLSKEVKRPKNHTNTSDSGKSAAASELHGMSIFDFRDKPASGSANTDLQKLIPSEQKRLSIPTTITLRGSEFFFVNSKHEPPQLMNSGSLAEDEDSNNISPLLHNSELDHIKSKPFDENIPTMPNEEVNTSFDSSEKADPLNKVPEKTPSEPTVVLNTSDNSLSYPPIPDDLLDAIPKW